MPKPKFRRQEGRGRRMEDLFRSENTIPCVAEAGKDVPVPIQLPVQHGRENPHIRVGSSDLADALRGGEERDKADLLRPFLLEEGEGRTPAPARGQHGIEEKNETSLKRPGKLGVVIDRLEGLLVPVDPDMTHARFGEKIQKTLHESESGPEHRDDHDVIGEPIAGGVLQRCPDAAR
jgi:hypothetical protein